MSPSAKFAINQILSEDFVQRQGFSMVCSDESGGARPMSDDVLIRYIDQGSTPGDALAGAAVYSRPILALYDLGALGLANAFVWKCPTRALRDLYDANVSASHL